MRLILGVLILLPVLAAAETAYVTDNLRLGLHAAEDTSDRAFRFLESGQAMEILSRDRNYANVRLPDGTEGWVKLEFTITETGTVKDPRVIDSQPPRIFNREAIRAILKWKFKPRVVDGVAVERRATQTIDFKLENS